MCGIVGATSQRNITNILIECLKLLEYRGYDSAGLAIHENFNELKYLRAIGKIQNLEDALKKVNFKGNIGIAHTRWATHGQVTKYNAHPHISNNTISLVHNGIIENYNELKDRLIEKGYTFQSETDTEIIAHTIHMYYKMGDNFLTSVHKTVSELRGAFALAIMNKDHPGQIIAVRQSSPLVIGIGIEENFVASDSIALLPVTRQFIYLEEGDIATIEYNKVKIYDSNLKSIERQKRFSDLSLHSANRGNYRHFMQKEMFEQPRSIYETMEGRFNDKKIFVEAFGNKAKTILKKIKRIQIVACGSSYHAGIVGKYWLESITKIPCNIEIASEFRYRKTIVEPNSLFVAISQSGETADTLGALRHAKTQNYLANLTICNVPDSTLVRESDLVFLTRAGIEVGVASTKGHTTQLTGLFMLAIALGQYNDLSTKTSIELIKQLKYLPKLIEQILLLNEQIKSLAKKFTTKEHAFFLGRGINYPVAMEGALKMKELSYIHAEAYPAGELKHGPLALIDNDMLIVAIVQNDHLLEKLKSNLHEVNARGGKLIIFTSESTNIQEKRDWSILKLPDMPLDIIPIAYTIPLQLLAYHVAVLKGTDVDRPRNLAKSVTVE